MQWNIVPECISLIFVLILLVYSREYNLILTLKNKLFRLFLRFVFFEILISIISVVAIENHRVVPEIVNEAIQIVFFLASPLMMLLFVLYLLAIVSEDDPNIFTYFRIMAIPYILYAVFVLANPMTGLLYDISEYGGFIYGKWFLLTYIIPILYILAIFFIVLINTRKMERSLKLILLSFPIISLTMIGVQLIFPTVILSGSAAASATLIVYLYFQNKQIMLDDLTGLQNRRGFLKGLEFYVNRKVEMDLVLISLDDFKAINDKYGQLNGDNLLKVFSKYLMNIVSIKYIYRFSGDEFIIILDQSFHVLTAAVVGAIRKRFCEHWHCNDIGVMLTTSISVVRVPDNAETVEDIITLLEFGVTMSKKSGKGKTIFSDADIVNKMRRRSNIVDIMKRGLTQDCFKVHYQPIYSVKSGQFTTAEALIHLSDSKLGVIYPNEFIPIAEESALIVDIGLLVMEKVCQFIKELDDKGVEFDAISINLSYLQLNSEGFVESLLEIVNRNRVNPSRLRMEITESVFIDNFEHVANLMRQLGEYGIRFYLDDFGTGYSNIANMAELPFEFIKIDKSILYESIDSKKCFTVINGLSKTFSKIGMKIVVEGVETMEHRKMAEQIKADYIQGFLFARPLPAAEAIRYLGRSFPLDNHDENLHTLNLKEYHFGK